MDTISYAYHLDYEIYYVENTRDAIEWEIICGSSIKNEGKKKKEKWGKNDSSNLNGNSSRTKNKVS